MFKTGMISLAAAAALMMTGCSAEGDKTTTAADDTHVVNPVTMHAKGVLVDENGAAIASQKVVVNGVTVTTGTDGSFAAAVTVYPNIEGTVGANTGNLAISVADFSVTDATAGTTTDYLGANGSVNVTAQAADGTGGGATDAVLFQNLNGQTYNFGNVAVASKTATQVVRFEDDTTEETVASALTLTLTTNGYNTFMATGTLDTTTNLVTYSNLPAGTHTYYAADTTYYHDGDNDNTFDGSNGQDDFTLSAATNAVTVDIGVEEFGFTSDGDTTNPTFVDIDGAIMNANYATTGANGVWVSPTIDGTSANPLVINFSEPVTVATDAISIQWAKYDTTEYDTANTAVETAQNAYVPAITAALAKKDEVAKASKAIVNYLATDTNTSDNNSTGDTTFAGLWSTYKTALTAYETELEKLGNDLQTDASTNALTDADNTAINGLDFSVAICDNNSSQYTTTSVTTCASTYDIDNAGVPAAVVAENGVDATVAETALGKALGLANAEFGEFSDAIIWNELTTSTVTPTSSGDSVSIVTGTALPSSEVSSGQTVNVMVTFKQTGITDASGMILGTTGTTTTGSTGVFERVIYFNVAD